MTDHIVGVSLALFPLRAVGFGRVFLFLVLSLCFVFVPSHEFWGCLGMLGMFKECLGMFRVDLGDL